MRLAARTGFWKLRCFLDRCNAAWHKIEEFYLTTHLSIALMEIKNFIENFENAVDGIPAGGILPETEFKKLPQWDSLALLSLLAMVDGEYGVQITGKEVSDCNSIADLVAVLEQKLN